MSGDVECPYCKYEFDPNDHYESGEYECPECEKEMYLEVEFDPIYDAYCKEDLHAWEPCQREHLLAEYPNSIECRNCGAIRTEPAVPPSASESEVAS